MINDQESRDFMYKLAKSSTGKRLIEYLEKVEIHYADIRNLNGVSADARIDALKIFREALTDKLKVLSGEVEAPIVNEFS